MSQRFPPVETDAPHAGDDLYSLAYEAILENASWCLQHSSYPQLWGVTCEFYEGVLTLRGVVRSDFLKQLAHVTVGDVVGVDEVANQLDVRYSISRTN